jgi:hypothetical protein
MTAKLSDLVWEPHPNFHVGERAVVDFPNGYSASILRGGEPFSYTDGGTYELAVLCDDDLCEVYGVLGHLTEDEVNGLLIEIEKL